MELWYPHPHANALTPRLSHGAGQKQPGRSTAACQVKTSWQQHITGEEEDSRGVARIRLNAASHRGFPLRPLSSLSSF